MTNIATELTKLEQTILITGSDKIRFNFYKSLIIMWKVIFIFNFFFEVKENLTIDTKISLLSFLLLELINKVIPKFIF